MGHQHSHAIPDNSNERTLRIALWLTTGFLVVEAVGGIITKSLALISDAAHMFTDTAALVIALAAIRIGKRAADTRRTFGYYRFEILAAAFNALLLFGVAVYILVEAYQRLQNPPEIESTAMLVIAAVGLCVNILSMRLLNAGKERSLNVKGAYLEVWSDMLGSVGVIFGAVVIRWTHWVWVDSVIAVAIGLWVLPRTWTLLKESLNILLEGVPANIDIGTVEQVMREVPGVRDIHDLHVWALTSGRTMLTAHVVYDVGYSPEEQLLPALETVLAERFQVFHTTLQFERVPCAVAHAGCAT